MNTVIIEKVCGKIGVDQLSFESNEVAFRLGTERGYTNETIEKCKPILLGEIDCRYTAVRVKTDVKDRTVDLGFFKTESFFLANNLKGCDSCFIMAVTLGQKVDMLLKRLSVLSAAEYYITDALASALADCAADRAEDAICGNKIRCPRFSPGYFDLPLELQPEVLKAVEAQKYTGITLSKNYLMIPQKSITAFIGIKN